MIARTRTQLSNSLKRTAAAMLVCGLAVTGTSVANADTSLVEVPKIEVKYTDLDLTRHEGVVALYARIARAAREVCPPEGSLSAREASAARACIREAISRAVKEVDSPQLAEVEASRRSKLS